MTWAVRGVRAEALAGVLAVITYCLGQALAGRFPFGAATRSVNDYGTQLIPQYARLRDVLTGQAQGDLWFNWSSALGVPYVGDLGAYMSSPLSLLVVVFPRDQVDLAAFVIQQLHLALAAAAMTAYLRRTGDGSWLVATALGAAYATCGWAVDDAAVFTTWLTGLIGLPVLALVGEWSITGRRSVLGPVLVALVWFANFYSAYMATIGAGLLLVCRLVVLGLDRREAMRAVLRAGWSLVLGIALAAPLLVPLLAAIRSAQASGTARITRADLVAALDPDIADLISRLLPATVDVGVTPAVYVTTPVALLAMTLAWNRRLPARVRFTYPIGLVAVLVSIFWVPSHVAWHGFDVPDGSPYRQAFVVCGWLVVLAWTATNRHQPDAVAWAGGALSLAAVWVLGGRSEPVSMWTAPLLVVALVVMGLAVALSRHERSALTVLGGAMALVVLVEGSVTAMVVGEHHNERFTKRPGWMPQQQEVRTALLDADAWPSTRTTVGLAGTPGVRQWATSNDSMLVGGQGVSYYSSLMPRTTTRTIRAAGVTWIGFGRSILDTPDPVRDAVLGIGRRVEASADGGVPLTRTPSAPIVTARTPPELSGNVFRTRNALAGAEAYSAASTEVVLPDGTPVPAGADGTVGVPAPTEGPTVLLRATCPAGSRVHLSAPFTSGSAQLAVGPVVELMPGQGGGRLGVYGGGGPVDLGPAPGGQLTVPVYGTPGVILPAEPLACFDPQALDAGIRALQESAATVSAGGHSFTARWDDGVDGTAVALVTATDGWRCSTGGPWQPPDPSKGFITVDMAGSDRLDCSFRPPGLWLGLALGLLALVALLAPAAVRRRRGRGAGTAPAEAVRPG